MKTLYLLLAVTVATLAVPAEELDKDLEVIVKKVVQSNGKLEGAVDDSDIDKLYSKFRQSFRSEEKLKASRGIQGNKEKFSQNVKDIIKHNAKFEKGEVSFKQGLSQFSDLDLKEVLKHFTGVKIPGPQGNDSMVEEIKLEKLETMFPKRYLPTGGEHFVDWSSKMPPVENQGACGSCYTFSALGVVEAAYGQKTGKRLSLSKQQIVDCDPEAGGCEGGWPINTLKYAMVGLKTTTQYKYEGKKGTCRASGGKVKVAHVFSIPKGDEKTLLKALDYGAVSICMDVTDKFSRYKSGIYEDESCDPIMIKHAMVAVGYGEENGKKYVLVRNSWGTSWGDKGHIKVLLNGRGSCGVSNYAVMATI